MFKATPYLCSGITLCCMAAINTAGQAGPVKGDHYVEQTLEDKAKGVAAVLQFTLDLIKKRTGSDNPQTR